MRPARLIPFAFAALAFTSPSRAQDVDGSKDHPMFSRMPGYVIGGYNAPDFGAYAFNVGKDEPKNVEGRFWHIFDTGKATITPESAPAIAVIGELLKSDPSLKLEIQGHTDNVGAAAANMKLSQDRALAVKAYVVQTFGIADARLTTAGRGDTKPVADNKTEDGRAQNRRVELVKK